MASRKLNLPAWRLILLAAAAGLAAGAIAVYVTEPPQGNNPAQVAATAPASSRADAACTAKDDAAKAIGAAATGEVAAMLSASPPQALSSLAFNGPDGKPMTLDGLAGKTVLLNLWAVWCAPCRAEMPALDRLQKTLGSDDFEVAAINVDTGDDTKPRKFLDEIGIETLAYYREPTLALFNDLKRRGLALGLPVTLLIDNEGCMLAHMNGPAEWDSEDAARLIAAARDAAAQLK